MAIYGSHMLTMIGPAETHQFSQFLGATGPFPARHASLWRNDNCSHLFAYIDCENSARLDRTRRGFVRYTFSTMRRIRLGTKPLRLSVFADRYFAIRFAIVGTFSLMEPC